MRTTWGFWEWKCAFYRQAGGAHCDLSVCNQQMLMEKHMVPLNGSLKTFFKKRLNTLILMRCNSALKCKTQRNSEKLWVTFENPYS